MGGGGGRRRGRPGRDGQRGAETLELMGGLPLLAMTMLIVWQGVVLMRQQAEVESDARLLARAAVICAAAPPSQALLTDLDPTARDARIQSTFDRHTQLHSVGLTLAAQSVLPGLDITSYRPHAVVVMHAEPC